MWNCRLSLVWQILLLNPYKWQLCTHTNVYCILPNLIDNCLSVLTILHTFQPECYATNIVNYDFRTAQNHTSASSFLTLLPMDDSGWFVNSKWRYAYILEGEQHKHLNIQYSAYAIIDRPIKLNIWLMFIGNKRHQQLSLPCW